MGLNPEWISAVGIVLLGAMKFGYDVWKDIRDRPNESGASGHNEGGSPPAAAA